MSSVEEAIRPGVLSYYRSRPTVGQNPHTRFRVCQMAGELYVLPICELMTTAHDRILSCSSSIVVDSIVMAEETDSVSERCAN